MKSPGRAAQKVPKNDSAEVPKTAKVEHLISLVKFFILLLHVFSSKKSSFQEISAK